MLSERYSYTKLSQTCSKRGFRVFSIYSTLISFPQIITSNNNTTNFLDLSFIQIEQEFYSIFLLSISAYDYFISDLSYEEQHIELKLN